MVNAATNYTPHYHITRWGGEIVGGMSLLLEVCAPCTIGDFELCLVTSKLQFLHSDREIILRDIPRGRVFVSQSPAISHPFP